MSRGPTHVWLALLLLVQQVYGIGVLRVHPFCPVPRPCEAHAPMVGAPSACCRGTNGPREVPAKPCVTSTSAESDGCIGLALGGAAGCTPCCRYTLGLDSAIVPAPGSAKQLTMPDGHGLSLPPVPFQPAAIAHAARRAHTPPVPAFVEGRLRRATLCVRTI